MEKKAASDLQKKIANKKKRAGQGEGAYLNSGKNKAGKDYYLAKAQIVAKSINQSAPL